VIPGEIHTLEGEIELNADRQPVSIVVGNTGYLPGQVAPH